MRENRQTREPGDDGKALKRVLLWLILLLLVVGAAPRHPLLPGCSLTIRFSLSDPVRATVVILWESKTFARFLLGESGLTPLEGCANLGHQVADFEPRKAELFRVPYCLHIGDRKCDSCELLIPRRKTVRRIPIK